MTAAMGATGCWKKWNILGRTRRAQNSPVLHAGRGELRSPRGPLTAYAKAEDRSLALAAGYQRHLSKPVEPADLVAAVASLVDRAAPGSPAAVEEPGAR